MNKKLLFLILLGILILPTTVSGQVIYNTSITDMAVNVAWAVWFIATLVVVICWVVTGILFLTAMGDPTKLGTAKKALFAAVGGTIIIILAYSAIGIIEKALIFRQ